MKKIIFLFSLIVLACTQLSAQQRIDMYVTEGQDPTRKLIPAVLMDSIVQVGTGDNNSKIRICYYDDLYGLQREEYLLNNIDSIIFNPGTLPPAPAESEAIDLGLSVKWAPYNLGATKPEGFGRLCGFGDPTGENTSFVTTLYPDVDGNIKPAHISGTKFDVAHVKWGGKWRLPTKEEQAELRDKCKSEWVWWYNGVTGKRYTGPNGKSIFLPSTGFRSGEEILGENYEGVYMSGDVYYGEDGDDHHMWVIWFYNPLGATNIIGGADSKYMDTYIGVAVRPVLGN